MNWLKKKLKQFSDKLNADDDAEISPVPVQEKATPNSGSPAIKKDRSFHNIEELKEVAIGAITSGIKMLGHSNSRITGVAFHSRFAESAIENVAIKTLIDDPDFLKQVKRAFKSKDVAYTDDFKLEVLHNSPLSDKVTKIMDGLGAEVLTPGQTLKKVSARVVATEGITWEPEYILESSNKNYFIGRCKDPKIENGPKIHNDIAFVGIEEKDEEQYKINNYISRAHANIIFDKDLGAFKIYRSKFLNNPSHKIKIYNTSQNDYAGVSLSQAAVPHILKDGDSICFNDKIVLEFSIIDQKM
ncbi:hypothetical protein ABDK00_010515 [Niabella insulamsoli]|uniref:hypothetical protein n=1 Tax=Niabella insulamsoli TaxID=3144874 RepID=UPI0031FDD88B